MNSSSTSTSGAEACCRIASTAWDVLSFGLKQQSKCGFDIADLILGKSLPLQTDRIDAEGLCVSIADGFGVWQYVFRDHRISAHIAMSPDTAELVNSGKGSDCRVILNRHMPGQSCRIGHDDVTANNAVMSDVRGNHHEIVVADTSVPPSAFGAAMDIDVFAKLIVGADRQEGFLAMEFQVLRLNADDAKRKEPIGIAYSGGAFDDDMRIQLAIVANCHAYRQYSRKDQCETLAPIVALEETMAVG